VAMPTLLSVEKRKVFSVPYQELFRICEDALLSLGLKITEKDQSSGVLEARKPGLWPLKSKEGIFLKFDLNTGVTAIAKMDMAKAMASTDFILDQFFEGVRQRIQDHS
jgi:hypothetical protein